MFSLSLRDVQLILAERGAVVSDETVQRWCKKFAASFANRLRRRCPRPGDKWHLDGVFIRIKGVQHYLWRAVDQDGVVLDIPADHRNLNSILSKGEADLTRPLLVSASDGGPEMGPRNVQLTGESAMTAKICALVPAMVLAFGAATALAQPTATPFTQFNQPSLIVHSVQLRHYDQGSAIAADAAYIGDGSDPSYLGNQGKLELEPGYSVGTGAARSSGAR